MYPPRNLMDGGIGDEIDRSTLSISGIGPAGSNIFCESPVLEDALEPADRQQHDNHQHQCDAMYRRERSVHRVNIATSLSQYACRPSRVCGDEVVFIPNAGNLQDTSPAYSPTQCISQPRFVTREVWLHRGDDVIGDA